MNLLLVGSHGLLGREIYNLFSTNRHTIIELNRSPANPLGFADYQLIEEILKRNEIDLVISTAWITSRDEYRNSNQNEFYKDATINLAKQSLNHGVKYFVGFGTAAEYGENNHNCNSIKTKLNPLDSYSLSKVETYLSIYTLFENSGTNFIWARVFQPYGTLQDETRFMPQLISAAKNDLSPVIDFPMNGCDWISTYDVAQALKFAIENELTGALDVGTGRLISNIDLARLIFPKEKLENFASLTLSEFELQGLSVAPDSPLFKAGWAPRFQLEKGIEILVKGSLWED